MPLGDSGQDIGGRRNGVEVVFHDTTSFAPSVT